MKVVIVDYGVGNIRSLGNALENIGCEVVLSRDPHEILTAGRVILPGVGSFPYCMARLKEYGLDVCIKHYVSLNKPILGICVGMQMLFDYGEEHGGAEGLGIIAGRVMHFSRYAELLQVAAPGRLPHIEWNQAIILPHPNYAQVFNSANISGYYYFVHSFVCVPDDEGDVLATTVYEGIKYCSMVIKGRVCGVQFHPEKSGVEGLALLKSFVFMSNTGL